MDLLNPVAEVESQSAIKAMILPQEQRSGFMRRYFGKSAFMTESVLFSFMDKLCESYTGGYWEFVELTNGAMFLFPKMSEEKVRCTWAENYSEEMVSPEAAGITATLMALSYMSFKVQGDDLEKVCQVYDGLREFVYEHPEARSIIALTD